MGTTTIKTYRVSVCSGLQQGYSGKIHPMAYVRRIVQSFVATQDLCVTLTPTHLHYHRGSEPGVIVGFVRDPFVMRDNLYDLALELGKILKEALGQETVFIIGDDYTTCVS